LAISADMAVFYLYTDKEFVIQDSELILGPEGGPDASLSLDVGVRMSSRLSSYWLDGGTCQLDYENGELGDVVVDTSQSDADNDISLIMNLYQTNYTALRHLGWQAMLGATSRTDSSVLSVKCLSDVAVYIFHVFPVHFSMTVRKEFEFQSSYDEDISRRMDESAVFMQGNETFLTSFLQPAMVLDSYSPEQVAFNIHNEALPNRITTELPVKAFNVVIPDITYHISTTNNRSDSVFHNSLLSFSSLGGDFQFIDTDSSGNSYFNFNFNKTFSFDCAEDDSSVGGVSQCRLLDAMKIGDMFEDFRAGALNVNATTNDENVLVGLLGNYHFVKGRKSNQTIPFEYRTGDFHRHLQEKVTPRDPDVSRGDECTDVNGDDYYDSLVCLVVEKGFILSYLNVSDENGVISITQAVTAWAVQGGLAFTSDIHSTVRGGYIGVVNVSASDDYRNASLIAQFSKDYVNRVYTNAFVSWELQDLGHRGDVNYWVKYVESFDNENNFTSSGNIVYGDNSYKILALQNMNMYSQFYFMDFIAVGRYGSFDDQNADFGNCWLALDHSNFNIDHQLKATATGNVSSIVNGNVGDILLNSVVVNDKGRQMVLTDNQVTWALNNDRPVDSTISARSLLQMHKIWYDIFWDGDGQLVFTDQHYDATAVARYSDGSENLFVRGNGRYSGYAYDFGGTFENNWKLRLDSSEYRVDGHVKGSATGLIGCEVLEGGNSGDILLNSVVVNDKGRQMVLTDNQVTWALNNDRPVDSIISARSLLQMHKIWYDIFWDGDGQLVFTDQHYDAKAVARYSDGSELLVVNGTGRYETVSGTDW
jgi:hypothetical protein